MWVPRRGEIHDILTGLAMLSLALMVFGPFGRAEGCGGVRMVIWGVIPSRSTVFKFHLEFDRA